MYCKKIYSGAAEKDPSKHCPAAVNTDPQGRNRQAVEAATTRAVPSSLAST